MAPPSLGGTPDPVGLGDWLLVEWVATARVGDPFPEPWCHAHDPPGTMVGRLTELGVMTPPAPGFDPAALAREASQAAKRWLERHPRPGPAPQEAPRHLGFGLAPDLAPEALGSVSVDDEAEPAGVRMRRLVLERLREGGGSGPTGV